MSVEFSIVMPTYNRSEFLYYTLGSLKRQGLADMSHELIVLNDGDVDETENVATTSDAAEGLNIRYLYTGGRTQKFWRNMGFTANIGIRQAKGDIVILTTSDIFHTSHNIRPVIDLVQEDPKALSTLNEVYDDQGSLIAFLTENPQPDEQQLKRVIRKVKLLPRPPGLYPANPEVPFFMAIDRQALLDVGGYDEDFIGQGVEDVDLLERLQAIGYHFARAPRGCEAIHLYHGRKSIRELYELPGFHHNLKLKENRKGQIQRNQGRNWGELIDSKAKWDQAPMHLVLWVTSKCNLECPQCDQAETIQDCSNYEMEWAEFTSFISRCRHRGLHFSTIELSGGEPTLWLHFTAAIEALCESNITDDVTFITNGNNASVVAQIANHFHLRYTVSEYQSTLEQQAIHRVEGAGVMFNTAPHLPNPQQPLHNVLPTDCSQQLDKYGRVVRQLLYRQGRIWYCCMAYPNATRLSYRANPSLSCSFEEDFDALYTQRWPFFPICSACLCNNRVWATLEQKA